MKSTLEMVSEFHEAFDISQPEEPGWTVGAGESNCLRELAEYQREVAKTAHTMAKSTGSMLALRVQLMAEELAEVIEAMETGSVPETLHELADLRVVCDGTALQLGLGKYLEPAVAEVHRANMSKLEDGKPVKDPAGRVKKGRYFQKADVRKVLP